MAVKATELGGGRKRRSYETDEFQRRQEQDRFGAVNPNRGDGNYVGKTNSKPKPSQTSLGNPKGLRDLEKTSGSQSAKSRRDDYGGYSPGVAKKPAQTSLGNPKGLRDLEKPSQTSLGNPKGLRDLDKKTDTKPQQKKDVWNNARNQLRKAMGDLTVSAKTSTSTSKPAGMLRGAARGYSGDPLRAKGEEKRYVSGAEYEAYRRGKIRKQKDTEASRIAEAERRAAAGEPLRAKGEEKRYVSGAEYEAYRKAKNKAKKGK